MESDQSASRAARRFLQDRVRNDWDWPNLPPCFSASDEEVRDVTVFRERFYGTSSDVSSNEEEGEGAQDQTEYKFDGPDSVGVMMEVREERRRRRRRERERKEIEGGNEGLRMYVQRRDAWTGVRSVRKYGVRRAESKNTTAAEAHSADEEKAKKQGETTETTVIPDPAENPSPAASIQSSSNATTPLEAPLTDTSLLNSPPLVPVAPPLLPNNSIRTSITPKTYPDIYSKIVLQSRTPAVPINLSDMTKALVLGWKEHGEWPPKSGPLDPLAGKKKHVLAGIGLHHGGAAATGAVPGKSEPDEPFLSNHPHLQKGVEHLQKMLHLRTGGNQNHDGETGQHKDATGHVG